MGGQPLRQPSQASVKLRISVFAVSCSMADRSAPPSPPGREEDCLSFSVQSFFVDDAGCVSSVTLPWHVDLAGGAQGEDACLRLLVAVAKAHLLFPAPDPVPAAAAAEGAAPPLLPPATILPPAFSATSKGAGRQSKAAASGAVACVLGEPLVFVVRRVSHSVGGRQPPPGSSPPSWSLQRHWRCAMLVTRTRLHQTPQTPLHLDPRQRHQPDNHS